MNRSSRRCQPCGAHGDPAYGVTSRAVGRGLIVLTGSPFPTLLRSQMISLQRVTKTYKNGVTALDRRQCGGREGRVRLHRRAVGIGQVDDDPPAPQGRRGHQGRHLRRGQEPRQDVVVGRAEAAAQRRHRLPGLQAPAGQDRVRERGIRARGDRQAEARDRPAGARDPRLRRARREAEQLPRRALGRRAAACVDRASVREPSAGAARRRAHRQPRPEHERRHHAAARQGQSHRHDGRDGDPRPGDRRRHAQARDRARQGPRDPRPVAGRLR